MAARILIVEDDEELNEVLQYNLRRSGYEVLQAWDGLEARQIIAREKPDLVLLDLMLPGVDGWEVCRSMRSSDETRDTPVVIFTARSSREDFDQMRDFNLAGYFTKPYATPDVLRHVEKVLAARPKPAAAKQ